MRSVYIHIPFCKSICSYCDFCKFYYHEKWVGEYFVALENEIKQYYLGDLVFTMYIGGGTPSCLSMDELEELFRILQIFDLKDCKEFTFECNIESITEEMAIFLLNHGVNRLSIGVETFHEKYLSFLNRHHSMEEVQDKIMMLKRVGFVNINVDLIYAVPGETIDELKKDLELFLSLDIPHISTYSLMIEPATRLGVQKVETVDEELDALMYETIDNLLTENGFFHYEVSNFSKRGFSSIHNLVYWNNDEYYGFGIGASGYVNGIRYDNTRNYHDYVSGNYRLESHQVSMNEKIENEFILGFRKLEGISLDHFYHRYGRKLDDYSIIQKLVKEGKLIVGDGNIKIASGYVYVSNQILCQLIGEIYE